MLFRDVFSNTEKGEIVKEELVLWLDGHDFRNNPTTSSWRDRSNNGNNATPSGFAYTASSGSDGNGGITFDGVDDYFSILNSSTLQPKTGSWSVEILCRREGACAGDYPQLIGSRPWTTSRDKGWSVAMSTISFKLCVHYADGTNGKDVGDTFSASIVDLNIWNHWIVVFDRVNDKLQLYKNNSLDKEYTSIGFSSLSSINQTDNIYIGREIEGSNARKFNGKLERITCYNKALTSQDVARLYFNAKQLQPLLP